MKLVKPNYKARTPVFNANHFDDSAPVTSGSPPLATPTTGSPQASFNPGANASPFPNGPPKYVQPKGKRVIAKGLTNKRITGNI